MNNPHNSNKRMLNRLIQMEFEQSMEMLKTEGFKWESFQDLFPFGYLQLREGEYEQLVNDVLDDLPDDKQCSLLLDLIDSQWCAFIEQLRIVQSFCTNPEDYYGECNAALARLQGNSNIRGKRKLPRKNGYMIMVNLGEKETLMDRISDPAKNKRATNS